MDALVERATQLAAIVEGFGGQVSVCSADYHIEFMNERIIERYGRDATGELCYKAMHNRDTVCPWCVNARVLAGETVQFVVQVQKNSRWYHVTNTPIRHLDGTVSKLAVSRDITDLKMAEEAVRQQADRLRVLHQMDQAILAAESPAAIARAVLDHVRRLVPCVRASVAEFDWGREEVIILASHDRDETSLGEGVRRPLAEFGVTETLQKGKVFVMEDLADPARLAPLRRALYDEGVRSYINVPMMVRGRLIGALNIGSDKPGAFDAAAVEIALEMAGPVALAIERHRAEEERRDLEARIERARRLEGLGLMAGGIAHDFNNLLVAILGNIDLGLTELREAEAPARASIEQAGKAALRAAELTAQLLAYSGKGKFVTTRVDLSRLARETADLLRISIAARITLRSDLAPDLQPVTADETQMRQVIMNLITNAADAIGDQPGVIAVRTRRVQADAATFRSAHGDTDLTPGPYVAVEVSDTGCGMDAAAQARMFDPFFTTKFSGRGLGLAVVLGIVRAHHGAINVMSTPGKGTTFSVLFPEARRSEGAAAAAPPPLPAPAGGMILIVDDEEGVRRVARLVLERAGFHVLTAANGREGIEQFRLQADRISAVLLDMIMPDLGGEEVLAEIRKLRPEARVIISSGYDETQTVRGFAGTPGGQAAGAAVGFIQKPYLPQALVAKVREAMAK
jgi:signal transduction histidine kinase/CheY-like chemotaxis protein